MITVVDLTRIKQEIELTEGYAAVITRDLAKSALLTPDMLPCLEITITPTNPHLTSNYAMMLHSSDALAFLYYDTRAGCIVVKPDKINVPDVICSDLEAICGRIEKKFPQRNPLVYIRP